MKKNLLPLILIFTTSYSLNSNMQINVNIPTSSEEEIVNTSEGIEGILFQIENNLESDNLNKAQDIAESTLESKYLRNDTINTYLNHLVSELEFIKYFSNESDSDYKKVLEYSFKAYELMPESNLLSYNLAQKISLADEISLSKINQKYKINLNKFYAIEILENFIKNDNNRLNHNTQFLLATLNYRELKNKNGTSIENLDRAILLCPNEELKLKYIDIKKKIKNNKAPEWENVYEFRIKNNMFTIGVKQ